MKPSYGAQGGMRLPAILLVACVLSGLGDWLPADTEASIESIREA